MMGYERGENETRSVQGRDDMEDEEQQGGGAIQIDPNHQLQSDGSPQPMPNEVKLPVTESRGSFAIHKDDATTPSKSSSATDVANDKGRPWRALNVQRIWDGIQKKKPPIAGNTEANIDSNEKNRLRRERNAQQFCGWKKAGPSTMSSNKNNAGDQHEKNRLRRERNAQAIRFTKKNTPSSGISSTTKETSNDGTNAAPSNKAKHCTDEDLHEKRRLRREQHALKRRQGNETTSPTITGASNYGTNEADAVGTFAVQPPAVESNRDLCYSKPNSDETPGAFAVQGPGSESRSWSHVFGRWRDGVETNQQMLQEDANLVIAKTVDAEAVHASGVVKERPRDDGGSDDDFLEEEDFVDPRCVLPIEEQVIYDHCHCQGNASLFKLTNYELEVYDFLHASLQNWTMLNHTVVDHESCDFENQALLRLANVNRNPDMMRLIEQFVDNFLDNDDRNASGASARVIDLTMAQLIKQAFVLQLLYLNTGGADWNRNDGWNSSFLLCSWQGVSCNFFERVQEVRLPFNNLRGTIPWQMGFMPFLRTLDLVNNPGLVGTLPPSLSQAQSLREIDLSASGLSGTLPPELSQLTLLDRLALSNTSFTGTLPNLGGLRLLRQLIISNAKLEGPLPSSLGDMTNLQVLVLRDNRFTGTIPESVSNLTYLADLDLSRNPLTGTIPLAVYKLDGLNQISVAGTKLTGEIPQEFCTEPDRDGHAETLILTSCDGNSTLANGPDCWCCKFSNICVEDLLVL